MKQKKTLFFYCRCDYEWETPYPPLTPMRPNANSSWLPANTSSPAPPLSFGNNEYELMNQLEEAKDRIASLEQILQDHGIEY